MWQPLGLAHKQNAQRNMCGFTKVGVLIIREARYWEGRKCTCMGHMKEGLYFLYPPKGHPRYTLTNIKRNLISLIYTHQKQ